MKKTTLSSVLLCGLFNFIFFTPSFAQNEQTPEAYMSLAQSYEKVKSYQLAAENYMKAGKAYEAKTKEYATDAAIDKNQQLAVDAYTKAYENYKNAKKIIEQSDAQKEAFRAAVPLMNKKLKAYQDSVKKNPPPDPKASIKQIPWKPGKKIIMAARRASFEMIMPEALKFTGPRINTPDKNPMMRKNEMSFSVVESNRPSPFFQFTLKEATDENGTSTTQSYCDDMAKLLGKSPEGGILGIKEIKTISIGKGVDACLITKESQQLDTKKYVVGWEVFFIDKKGSYNDIMTGIAPYEWKTCIQEMLKTFHITNEQAKEEIDLSCFGNVYKEVPGLAFEDTWMVPDSKGKLVIKLSPNLPRNKVPYAWHDLINATRKVVGQIEELSAKFETKEEQGVEMDVLEFVVDYFEVPQISPGQLADAYLEVLDKVITGISSLEGKISNMAVDLSYELPYTEVKTKCIPRFKCVNEKWEPDYSDMTFEIVSELKRVDKGNYFHLTPRQVQERETKIKEATEKMKENAKRVAEKDCGQNRYKLHDIKWPLDPRQCDLIEKKISIFKEQLKMYTDEKAALKKELADYSNTKSSKITTTKATLAKNKTELQKKQAELTTAEGIKKGYESNKTTMGETNYNSSIKLVNDKISKLESEMDVLNTEKSELNEQLAMLQSDKFERINSDRADFVNSEITRLNNEIKVVDTQLKSCREKEKLYQKN